MSYSYILLPEAQQEYESSIQWYLERSLYAAETFIAAVDHTLQLICDHPTWWRNQYSSYYELGVRKFPYTIIYSIEQDKKRIVVSAIYHNKRDPEKKYRK